MTPSSRDKIDPPVSQTVDPPIPARSSSWYPLLRRALVVTAVVLVLLSLGRLAGPLIPRFGAWVNSLGVWAPVVFIAGYIVAAVALMPGSVLSLAGGAIFGLVRGTVYVFIGGTLGAAAAFLVSRHLARAAVARRLEGNRRFVAIDRAIGSQGFKIAFLLRMTPVVPYNLVNYGLGLTSIRFAAYVAASAGMLPAIILYVYYGKVIGDVAALAGGIPMERDAAYYVVLGLGLAATIAVTTVITRVARRALREATGEQV
jgi:uncharacterized membrane protein YdjX (TVP38/TMEM64 family)